MRLWFCSMSQFVYYNLNVDTWRVGIQERYNKIQQQRTMSLSAPNTRNIYAYWLNIKYAMMLLLSFVSSFSMPRVVSFRIWRCISTLLEFFLCLCVAFGSKIWTRFRSTQPLVDSSAAYLFCMMINWITATNLRHVPWNAANRKLDRISKGMMNLLYYRWKSI